MFFLLIKVHYFTDQNKTSADVKKEGEILTEMLEIVAKRDSLIALLEEERQRWRRPSCPIQTMFTNSSSSSSNYTNNSFLFYAFAFIIILLTYIIYFYIIEFFISYHNGPLITL